MFLQVESRSVSYIFSSLSCDEELFKKYEEGQNILIGNPQLFHLAKLKC